MAVVLQEMLVLALVGDLPFDIKLVWVARHGPCSWIRAVTAATVYPGSDTSRLSSSQAGTRVGRLVGKFAGSYSKSGPHEHCLPGLPETVRQTLDRSGTSA